MKLYINCLIIYIIVPSYSGIQETLILYERFIQNELNIYIYVNGRKCILIRTCVHRKTTKREILHSVNMWDFEVIRFLFSEL